MSQETLLVTGSTGHVGYAVLLGALKKGYRVRAAVRSDAKAELVKSAEASKPYLSQLEFTIVKDITVSGAFDEAVKGVNAVVHVASPIPAAHIKNPEEELIKPAVHGTTSILYSALKEKSIRRIVITSSLAAVLPDEPKPFTASDILEETHAPFPDAMVGYRASKRNANIAVRKFIEKEKPHFTINNVMPSYVIGRNLLAKTTEEIDAGSNQAALGSVLGRTDDIGTFATVVHLDDVVHIHLSALGSEIQGNNSYGAAYFASEFKWDDTIKYAKEYFPEAVKSGILPLGGHTGDVPVHFDASEAEKTFNFKFKTPAEIMKDFLGQYIEAAQKA